MIILRTILCLVYLGVTIIDSVAQSKISSPELNEISFERPNTGLIFTTIQVNDKKVKAIIDFGDQHQLLLSYSRLTNKLLTNKLIRRIFQF